MKAIVTKDEMIEAIPICVNQISDKIFCKHVKANIAPKEMMAKISVQWHDLCPIFRHR